MSGNSIAFVGQFCIRPVYFNISKPRREQQCFSRLRFDSGALDNVHNVVLSIILIAYEMEEAARRSWRALGETHRWFGQPNASLLFEICGVGPSGCRIAELVHFGTIVHRDGMPRSHLDPTNNMAQVVIENPVINSPFREPDRHFRFTDDGISDEIVQGRRISSYFIPIAQPRKKGQKQLKFETEWTQDRIEENKVVNQIRERVRLWREGGYQGVTATTSRLLDYWTNPIREKRLFFCQIEALETAIYLTEAAKRLGDTWIENDLRNANNSSNPGLPRVAFKMATGSGKTVVMAMLIAWQALNKLSIPQDARFSDTFLIITPGITIRDRLRVLLPNDPQNYYRQRDVLPAQEMSRLGQAKIIIANYHGFQLRETVTAAKLTKAILGRGESSAFVETPDQMVRRVCRELGNKKNIIVLNDEAHHCYRRKPDGLDEKLTGDDREKPKNARRKPACGSRALRPSKPKSASKPSTIFPPRRSFSAAPDIPRGRCSRGLFQISR